MIYKIFLTIQEANDVLKKTSEKQSEFSDLVIKRFDNVSEMIKHNSEMIDEKFDDFTTLLEKSNTEGIPILSSDEDSFTVAGKLFELLNRK